MSKYKKVIFILIPAVCILLVLVMMFAVLYMDKDKEITIIDKSMVPANAYDVTLDIDTREKAETTIKEYSAANQADMLYFDWYEDEKLEWVLDFAYPDEDGGIYCLKESICKYLENSDYYISADISIFKEDSGVDFCEEVVNLGVQAVTINGVQVYWAFGQSYPADTMHLPSEYVLYAKINYGGYLYFIELADFYSSYEYPLHVLEEAFH